MTLAGVSGAVGPCFFCSSIPRAKLQLVGVSAMFLISKIEEVYAPAISDFVYITDYAYTDMDIRLMELRIIRALNFDLCQPISLNFLRYTYLNVSKTGIEHPRLGS